MRIAYFYLSEEVGFVSAGNERDMKVVAEGIECTQQLDMLQDTGCDMVQGFIYAKPCSEEDFYHRVETE